MGEKKKKKKGDLEPLEVGIVQAAADEAGGGLLTYSKRMMEKLSCYQKRKKSARRRPYQNPGTVHNQVYPSTHFFVSNLFSHLPSQQQCQKVMEESLIAGGWLCLWVNVK